MAPAAPSLPNHGSFLTWNQKFPVSASPIMRISVVLGQVNGLKQVFPEKKCRISCPMGIDFDKSISVYFHYSRRKPVSSQQVSLLNLQKQKYLANRKRVKGKKKGFYLIVER
jgi:hypothetical protein